MGIQKLALAYLSIYSREDYTVTIEQCKLRD